MSDIEILRSGETMLSHVSGESEEGIEFVDEYIPEHPLAAAEMTVIDSGRIILPNDDVEAFIARGLAHGLTVERTEGI